MWPGAHPGLKCVCIYVHMCGRGAQRNVHTCAYICTCGRGHTPGCTYTYGWGRTSACMCMYLYICTCGRGPTPCVHTHMSRAARMYSNMYTYIYICGLGPTPACMHVYIYIHMCVYMYMRPGAHPCVHMHNYIYMCVSTYAWPGVHER